MPRSMPQPDVHLHRNVTTRHIEADPILRKLKTISPNGNKAFTYFYLTDKKQKNVKTKPHKIAFSLLVVIYSGPIWVEEISSSC